MMNSSNESLASCQEQNSSWVNDLFIPYIICVAFNVPASVFALIGNALILAALRKTSSLHAPSKALLSNLALTDLCVGLVVQPLFVSILLYEIDLGRLPVSRFIFYCFSYPPAVVSFLTTTVISLDRLLALYMWRTYHEVMKLQRVIAILVFVWFTGALATVIAQLASYFVYMILAVTLTALCITFSSVGFLLVFRKLRLITAQVSTTQEAPPQGNTRSSLNVARYRKLAGSMWLVCCVLWLSYVPFIFLTIFLGVHCRTPWTKVAQEISLTLILLSSALNPVLYCWRIRDVRRATMKVLRQILCCVT